MTLGRTLAVLLTVLSGALVATQTNGVIAGQLTLAVVIDRLNLFGFGYHALDATRIAGVVLLAAGAWLILRH